MIGWIIIILLVVLVISQHESGAKSVETFAECTNIDGRCYQVLQNGDRRNSAQLLARLNKFNIALCTYMRARARSGAYDNNPVLIEVSNLLIDRYDPDALSEHAAGPDDTAVTINKGQNIKLCLKNVNWDTLVFVNLHELTHVATQDMDAGHSDNFWNSFKELLFEAENAGLYNPIDYAQNSTTYCGMRIAYNPYYDYRS